MRFLCKKLLANVSEEAKTILTIITLSIGLAMDAFAVSICDGMCMQLNGGKKLTICLAFGIFQAGMAAIGYFLGSLFMTYIQSFMHWIAFALLLFLGIKMIIDGIRDNKQQHDEPTQFSIKIVLVQALATSIDALAVGLTLHAIAVEVWLSCTLIGVITLALSLVGVILGRIIFSLFKGKTFIATILGGVALIGIGVKILIEGLVG